MTRNIVIFADGTGQRGGIFFDENRSNIYKLYRATRCGPEYSVNPAEQLTFYDPGVGTKPIEGNFFFGLYRRLHNLVSQATGLGLTLNMIECYAAIIRMWRPGDRIFVFGFSRGAYTVRALGGVLSFCGVPTHMDDGSPLLRDEASTIRIAKEAVKDVLLPALKDRACGRFKALVSSLTAFFFLLPSANAARFTGQPRMSSGLCD